MQIVAFTIKDKSVVMQNVRSTKIRMLVAGVAGGGGHCVKFLNVTIYI